MDSSNPSSDGAPDWNDLSMFTTSPYDQAFPGSSPYGSSALNEFTNLDAYGDSPGGLMLRDPSQTGHPPPNPTTKTGAQAAPSTSAESSSQDSSSESSGRRKRKTESQSPMSDAVTETGSKTARGKTEDSAMVMGDMRQLRNFDNTFAQPMHDLSLEQNMRQVESNISQYDFSSAASSPIKTGDFNDALSLNVRANMPSAAMGVPFTRDMPIQTINPGMFAMDASRDQSPGNTDMMFGQTSNNPIFSTQSSESPEAFTSTQNWNQPIAPSPWPNDFSHQLTSPGGMSFTPSPAANGSSGTRSTSGQAHHSPLNIGPISAKSRVETQINIIMTLERPPPRTDYLHLPLHTIAKSKLLAKEEHDRSRVLELHTMLVCTSAMHNAQLKEKALKRAAGQDNDEIQQRAEILRDSPDEEKNDPKSVDEDDRPANGGEVRICNNCIQRERKRAGRKKTKREEEQQHWERFETERVVVFNSNEYLPFKPCERNQHLSRESAGAENTYIPPEGAMQVAAAMRIACYCRHQSEKEGFQVIFTMKDHMGNVVAQEISDSILITDDHKTHPQSFSTPMANEGYFQAPTYLPNGLPMSHSMVDLNAHVQSFTPTRSHGNLQQLAYGAQFNPQSHIHQMSNAGFTSQTTSATMTPSSVSRPGSPTTAGQMGPNKKRKSSTFHRKLPSGLMMTPRVDTSQSPSSTLPSAMSSMSSGFSPNLSNQLNQAYMNVPQSGGGAGQYFGSGPPTPSENAPFHFGQSQGDASRVPSNQAYFSHPSSAVPSRSTSPVLQHTRANMAAYARQQPIQTPTNSINARPGMYSGQQSASDTHPGQYPIVSRIAPGEGPAAGGTEVVILGENFVIGNQVMFGEHIVPANFVNSTSIIAISPPGREGAVHLTVLPPPGIASYPQPPSRPIFKYHQHDREEMMKLALQYLSEQHFGTPEAWQTVAQHHANNFVQSRPRPAGLQQGYPSGQRQGLGAMEDVLLQIFDASDMSESPHTPNYDMTSDSGATMLSLACSMGMHRIVAALLARGANGDIRDKGGYTPLMQAAIHAHVKIFQLLVARGADPTVRSLSGHRAVDLSPLDVRDELHQVILYTQRRRHSRPSLRSPASIGSFASSGASWDVASASFYESEISSSRPASRRASIQATDITTDADEESWDMALDVSRLPETSDATAEGHKKSSQPPKTCSRRLRCLASCRRRDSAHESTAPNSDESRNAHHVRLWDLFTSPSIPNHAPPAYHDIFPESKLPDLRKLTMAAVGASCLVDEKRALRAEQQSHATPDPIQIYNGWNLFSDSISTLLPSWLWMTLLVLATSSILHSLLPSIIAGCTPSVSDHLFESTAATASVA